MWFLFFKQKTAYEMLRSLVGSEMCIRDRHSVRVKAQGFQLPQGTGRQAVAADLVAGKGRLVDEGDPSAGPGQGDGG